MSTQNSGFTPPIKDIDLDLLVFIQRYATSFLKWELLTYFAHHPHTEKTTQQLAQSIGQSGRTLRPEIGDLAILGVLDKLASNPGPDLAEPVYRLTANPTLRTQVLKLAKAVPPPT